MIQALRDENSNTKTCKPSQHKKMGVSVLIGLAFSLLFFALLHSSFHKVAATLPQGPVFTPAAPISVAFDLPAKGDSSADRPLYPYSVIPRGVSSARELLTALKEDSVVAAHYRGFHVASARMIRLGEDRQAFVSYRIGDRVYWTRKKVTLHVGEFLLTDGKNLARGRCGNRISEAPASPTSLEEPPTKVLNTPHAPVFPDPSSYPLPAPLWVANEAPPIVLSAGNLGPIPAPGLGGTFPPVFIPPACCFTSPSGPALLPQPGPPPLSTPEPGTIVLTGTGFAGLALLWKLHHG